MRITVGSTAGVLSPIFTKVNGMPGVPTVDPTVVVTRLDGTTLAAPTVSPEVELNGRWYAVLTPTHTSQIDRLTLEWTATVDGNVVKATDYAWVVSDILVRPAELYGEPDMNTKPPWLLVLCAEAVNDYCESYCNRAFGVRVDQELINFSMVRNGGYPLRWGGVSTLVTALGDSDDVLDRLQVAGGVVSTGRSLSWPWDDVVLTYRHGQPTTNGKLRWEALQAARQDVLARSSRSPRSAISETTAGVVVRYSTPDLLYARPTGYLTLDPVLEHERIPIGFA